MIHFDNFNAQDVFVIKPFDHIEFDDGSTLSHAQLMGKGFDITGTGGADRKYKKINYRMRSCRMKLLILMLLFLKIMAKPCGTFL